MNSSETLYISPENYKDQLTIILSKSLTPENINTYADSALNDLVDLSERSVRSYAHQPTVYGETNKTTEDNAFRYFEIGSVASALDHVAKVANDIDHLDTVIAEAEEQNHVILPAGKIEGIKIFQSSGQATEELEVKKLIPRLKTILFILKNDFNVNLDNQPDDISIEYGIVDPKAVRKHPYYVIDIPKIDRIVCVNDEDENVSYVLNSGVLKTLELDARSIQAFTKQEIDLLIKEHDGLGNRIVYSRQFVVRIKQALGADSDTRYLVPKAPEGIQSAKSAALSIGMSREKFLSIVEVLGEELGDTEEHKFGSVITPGYTSNQVQKVKEYHDQHKPKDAPGNVVSRGGLGLELGVSDYLLVNAIDELTESDKLGVVEEFTFNNKPADGYYPYQRQLIIDLLVNQGKIGNEKPPEGAKSYKAFAEELGVSRTTLGNAIDRLTETLGERRTYQFGSMVAPGLLVSQQDIIKEYLSDIKKIAPEGALSESGVANKFGTTAKTVRKAIISLSKQEKLGEVNDYTFGAKMVPGYLIDQQDLIGAWLDENHLLHIEEAPEDYVTAITLAKTLHVQYDRVVAAITALQEELGEVKHYRFGTRSAPGYSPDQQKIITDYLNENTAEKAPDDYLPEFGIVKKYGLSRQAVNTAIRNAWADLGEVQTHQYIGGPQRSFSPTQQAFIVGLARK